MKKHKFTTLLVCTLIYTSIVFSQTIPQTISYQGLLKNLSGIIVTNGDYILTFKLYDVESGGSALWAETKLITVVDGVINTHLGSVTPITLPFNKIYWLGITIGAESELIPRMNLNSVPYSLMTMHVMDASISTNKIQDNSVTANKILDEPGFNYNNTGNPNQLYPITTSGQSFTSVTLSAPADGFAVVYANAEVFITHTSGTMDNIILKVSKTSGDITTPSYQTSLVRIPKELPTTAIYGIAQGINITLIFSVVAGENTFYLNGFRSSGESSFLLQPEISAIFIPTRYGMGAGIMQKTLINNGTNLFLGE